MLTALDEALLAGPDATIKYYEPLIAAMSRSRATQERATLNEPDLAQHARLTVLRCYNSMNRDPNIRSFDGLVKDAIKKRLLTEVGKEFCVSRGRCVHEEFREVLAEEGEISSTPSRAGTTYKAYNDSMANEFNTRMLVEDIRALLPEACLPVLDTILEKEFGAGKSSSNKACRMSVSQYSDAKLTIEMTLRGYQEELFSRRYRPL